MGIKERHERDREAVRRSILDAARELFVSDGYQNVSIRKVAERIEYSPAAIYGYFPSKDDLFFALAEEGFRLLWQLSPEQAQQFAVLPPLDRVRAGMRHLYEFSRNHTEYFALMFLDRSVPRISQEYERFAFVRAGKEQLVEDLRQCVDAGLIPATVDPEGAFRLLTVGVIGVAMMRLCQRLSKGENADALAEEMLDVLFAGLRSGVTVRSHALPCLDTVPDESAITSGEPVVRTVRRKAVGYSLPVALVALSLSWAACGAADGKGRDQPAQPPAVPIAAAPAAEHSITRFLRATGTLTAEEHSEVAAETAGRVVSASIERGAAVTAGSELIRVSSTESDAQLREAEANAAQIEARLGIGPGGSFDVDRVPEVLNARSAYALAQSDLARIQSLLDQRVVSQAEFDQRRTHMEAAQLQLEAAKNGATQQYQALLGARARVSLAKKAAADTVVRAPYTGVVAQRLVSVGDYVTRGMKVVQVMRVNPIRAQLTVPEQAVSAIVVGQPITFEVDAFPGRVFVGTVRYVSPALQADQRALTVEAVVPNPENELKPGLFATARIQQPKAGTTIVVPAAAVRTSGGTDRVFVVAGDHVEERIVTTGEHLDTRVEIVSGLKAGDRVATTNLDRLSDGSRITP